MPNGGLHPPPKPTTPKEAPWGDVEKLLLRMDKLTVLMERAYGPLVSPAGAPGAPGVTRILTIPGAPGTVEQLTYLLAELSPEVIGNSQIIPFQKTVAVAYQDEQDRQIRIASGIVRNVVIAFPAGCHQLVEVRLMYFPTGGGYHLIVPSVDESFIALDDFTAVFEPRFPVRGPGNLRVEWWNYDSLNVHTVPVIVTIVPTVVMEVKS